jgi:hypothetical protein
MPSEKQGLFMLTPPSFLLLKKFDEFKRYNPTLLFTKGRVSLKTTMG